jgi:hypothetical protein
MLLVQLLEWVFIFILTALEVKKSPFGCIVVIIFIMNLSTYQTTNKLKIQKIIEFQLFSPPLYSIILT